MNHVTMHGFIDSLTTSMNNPTYVDIWYVSGNAKVVITKCGDIERLFKFLDNYEYTHYSECGGMIVLDFVPE